MVRVRVRVRKRFGLGVGGRAHVGEVMVLGVVVGEAAEPVVRRPAPVDGGSRLAAAHAPLGLEGGVVGDEHRARLTMLGLGLGLGLG